MGIEIGSEFGRALRRLIFKQRITCVLETGTHKGTGSTRFLSESLKGRGVLHSIECKAALISEAALITGPMGNVVLHHGLSVQRAVLPTAEEIKADIDVVRARYPDAVIDYSDPPREYAEETAEVVPADNLLPTLLEGLKPQLVLLDSAGHLGWMEWLRVLVYADRPVWVALDDTRHYKHCRSLAHAKSLGFQIKFQSQERNGSAIVRIPQQ